MENKFELSIQASGIPTINFVGYDKTLEDVKRLADSMKNTEVSEESIKEHKRLLASVRKQLKELDKERLAVKREVMTPYEELNEKINVLKSIIGEGEQHIDQQIKEFNAKEQELRKLSIKELFLKYQKSYTAPLWLTFDKFIAKNSSLITNKATSDKKIRESVVSYFETFKNDYAKLKEEYPDKDDRSAILIAYSKNGFNMNEAIMDYTTMIAEKERLEKEQHEANKMKVPEIVILTGKDVKQEVPEPVEEYVVIRVKKSDLAKINVEYEVSK
jgi:hypothetical protein